MKDMMVYIFETEPCGGFDDYGSTHLSIIADSLKNAWKEALRLEDEENIIRLQSIKAI